MELQLKVTTKTKEERALEVMGEELEPMSPTTRYFVSEVSLCVLAVFESEIAIDVPSVYRRLTDDFLPIHPRFSSVVVEDTKGNKMWKRAQVNMEEHIKVPTFTEGLSTECYTKHFDDYISKLAEEKLRPDRPLWEVHIFKYPTNNSAGLIIFKLHHALADGVTLMGVVFSCFERTDDPSLSLTFPSTKAGSTKKRLNVKQAMIKYLSIVPKFMSTTLYSLHDFCQSVGMSFVEDDRTPIRSGNSAYDSHFYRLCTVTVSFDDVKRIKAHLRVTVNDVIIGIIFLGCRLYMQEINKGQLKRTRSTATIAVNIRTLKGYASPDEMKKSNTKVPWGNKVSIIQLPIPNLCEDDLANPLKFVKKVHKTIKNKRTSFAPYLMLGLIEGIKTCGGIKVAGRIFENRLKNSSLPTSSLIGPIEQISLANHPIGGFYFMPVGVKKSLSVSVMSYMQKIRIGLGVEDGFIDHQRLVKCVEQASQLILQAATATPNCTTLTQPHK